MRLDILTANDRIGEYPRSWYAATAETLAPFPSAMGDLTCDVCLVGGGYMGLSTALHLAERGYDVILLEAHRVGWGASGRNGGQVGTGQRLEVEDLEKMMGREATKDLWNLSLEAVDLVRDLVAKHAPDAGWRDGIIHAAHRARYVPDYHAHAEHLATHYGYEKIRPLDREEMRHLVGSPAYHGGEIDMGGGHIHPLRYALGLARACVAAGVRIFETSRVTNLVESDPAVVETEQSRITTRHVVLGCNGYLGGLERRVSARVMPINNFIVATEPLSQDMAEGLVRGGHAVADSKFVINYFRLSEDNRMLFGGAESYGYKFPDIAKLVRKPMTEIFPQLAETQIEYAWGGTLGITLNRMPHFERVSGNVLSLSGFSGHGVAMATMAGKLAAEAIAGQAERFDLMASVPTTAFPGGAALRWPLLVLGMLWFSLRDRL